MVHICVAHAILLVCIPAQTPVTTAGMADVSAAPNVATPSSGVIIDTDPASGLRPLQPENETQPVQDDSAAPTAAAEPPRRTPPAVLRRAVDTPAQPTVRARPWYRSSIIGLAAVLGLILLVSYLLRRYVPAVRALGGGVLKVVHRTPLSSKQSLALVQLGERMVLIGITPEHISYLSVIDDPEECARLRAGVRQDARGSRGDFDEKLLRETGKFASPPVEAPAGRSEATKRLRDAKGHLEGMLTKLNEMRVS